MADESQTVTPAYVPWKTFTNTLDALTAHMPNRIDKSAFPGQSGAGQNQLMVAFRFFGLIADDGKPTPALLAVAVADEAARKVALKKLVEQKYAQLFALNLSKTTPAEFGDEMTRVYNITGDTKIKATRFFLSAASYLGVAVSPLLLRDRSKPAGNGAVRGTTRKRRVVRADGDDRDDDDDDDEGDQGHAEDDGSESIAVTLKSGGTLTLSATTKFMKLSSTDRNFVFGLIDKLEEYEKSNAEGK